MSHLVWINEDGFEMDGTCVPVRLTDAAINAMAEQRSEWWVEVGEELFTEPLRKRADGVLMMRVRMNTAERRELLVACAHTVWWYEANDGAHIAVIPISYERCS